MLLWEDHLEKLAKSSQRPVSYSTLVCPCSQARGFVDDRLPVRQTHYAVITAKVSSVTPVNLMEKTRETYWCLSLSI